MLWLVSGILPSSTCGVTLWNGQLIDVVKNNIYDYR